MLSEIKNDCVRHEQGTDCWLSLFAFYIHTSVPEDVCCRLAPRTDLCCVKLARNVWIYHKSLQRSLVFERTRTPPTPECHTLSLLLPCSVDSGLNDP